MTQPRQLPSMKAQGVGLSGPSVPVEMAWWTEWRGAENIMLANMHPRRGQMYSRIITLGVGILDDCSFVYVDVRCCSLTAPQDKGKPIFLLDLRLCL